MKKSPYELLKGVDLENIENNTTEQKKQIQRFLMENGYLAKTWKNSRGQDINSDDGNFGRRSKAALASFKSTGKNFVTRVNWEDALKESKNSNNNIPNPVKPSSGNFVSKQASKVVDKLTKNSPELENVPAISTFRENPDAGTQAIKDASFNTKNRGLNQFQLRALLNPQNNNKIRALLNMPLVDENETNPDVLLSDDFNVNLQKKVLGSDRQTYGGLTNYGLNKIFDYDWEGDPTLKSTLNRDVPKTAVGRFVQNFSDLLARSGSNANAFVQTTQAVTPQQIITNQKNAQRRYNQETYTARKNGYSSVQGNFNKTIDENEFNENFVKYHPEYEDVYRTYQAQQNDPNFKSWIKDSTGGQHVLSNEEKAWYDALLKNATLPMYTRNKNDYLEYSLYNDPGLGETFADRYAAYQKDKPFNFKNQNNSIITPTSYGRNWNDKQTNTRNDMVHVFNGFRVDPDTTLDITQHQPMFKNDQTTDSAQGRQYNGRFPLMALYDKELNMQAVDRATSHNYKPVQTNEVTGIGSRILNNVQNKILATAGLHNAQNYDRAKSLGWDKKGHITPQESTTNLQMYDNNGLGNFTISYPAGSNTPRWIGDVQDWRIADKPLSNGGINAVYPGRGNYLGWVSSLKGNGIAQLSGKNNNTDNYLNKLYGNKGSE